MHLFESMYLYKRIKTWVESNCNCKGMGGSQRDNDSSPNLSFNDLKQKEIEIKEGSARVLWYETQLLIGQPNGGSPKFQGGSPKLIFSQTYSLVYCSLSRVLRF